MGSSYQCMVRDMTHWQNTGMNFVYPLSEELSTPDPVIQGTVVLELTKPKRITRIQVKMTSRLHLDTPTLRLNEVLLEEIKNVPFEAGVLALGIHPLPFYFSVPVSTL